MEPKLTGAHPPARNPTVTVFLMILLAVSMEATGQMLYKSGINQLGPATGSARELAVLWRFAVDALSNARILAGIAIYCAQAIVWWQILSRVDLSYAFPLTSMSYLLVLIGAHAFLGERVTVERWLGATAVVFGVYLITRSGH